MHFIDKDLKFNFIVEEETDFQPLFYILHPHKMVDIQARLLCKL